MVLKCWLDKTNWQISLNNGLTLHCRSGNFPGGGGTWVNVYWVCAAGLSDYRPHLIHFLENVIFATPTQSLSIYASTISMWFQAAECNVVNASLLLNLINSNFLTFLTKNLPILIPCLPPKSENQRPYSSNSIENATPSSSTSPLASCEGVPPGKFTPAAGH